MKVALTLGGSDRGRSGIGRYVRSLLPLLGAELLDRGSSMAVFGTERDFRDYERDLPPCQRIVLPGVCDAPGWSAAWHLTWLGRQARAKGADVLLLLAGNRRVTYRAPVPTVAVVHDLAQLHVPQKYDALRMFYVKRVLVASLRTATRCVAVSRATRADLVERLGFPASSVSVVHNGVDVSAFQPAEPGSERVRAARERTGVRGPYLLYPSRLEHPGKNHIRLLQAFADSALRNTHALVLLGSDWGAEAMIRAEIERLDIGGAVRLAGHVDQDTLAGLNAGAEAVLVLGLHEGFGLPALEALAAGRPVVASRTGAAMEAVGRLGVSCDPYEVFSIRSALERVASDQELRRAAALEGPSWAAGWTWEKTARGLVDACVAAATARR